MKARMRPRSSHASRSPSRVTRTTSIAWTTSIALCLLTSLGPARADDALTADKHARPPLPPAPPTTPVPWERHIEVGGDVAFVARPASVDERGATSNIRYEPSIGYGVHARWNVLKYLRFSAYYVRSMHDVFIPRGALNVSGDVSLDSVKTFSFGARLSPSYPWSGRARTWLSGGFGWGRVEAGRMNVKEAGGTFFVRERAASFVELPLGFGTSFDIIPRWLSIDVEVTGAFVVGQEGELLKPAQAIDAAGKKRAIGVFPVLDATFVHTIGLSLVL